MNIEDLKNISVKLDSETAKHIADQYILWKYVDSAMAFICVMAIIIGIAMVVRHTVFGGKGGGL